MKINTLIYLFGKYFNLHYITAVGRKIYTMGIQGYNWY